MHKVPTQVGRREWGVMTKADVCIQGEGGSNLVSTHVF